MKKSSAFIFTLLFVILVSACTEESIQPSNVMKTKHDTAK